ncbi:MAG: hypothetical protein ACRDD1_09570, partial [Planctomycetia bacterium]
PVSIREFNPGCKCSLGNRKFSPRALLPGEKVESSLLVMPSHDGKEEMFLLGFSTNHGEVRIPAAVRVLASASVFPPSPHLGHVSPGELLDLNVTTIQVVKHGASIPSSSLSSLNDGVEFVEVGTRTGEGPVVGYHFHERQFVVKIAKPEMGSHTVRIDLRNSETRDLLGSSYISWQRRPHVISSPEKVYLGSRSIRVKLLSKTALKVDKIDAIPKGVSAVVDDGFIVVSPAGEISSDVDGFIELSLESDVQSQLKIPVFRRAVSTTNS